MSDSPLSQFTVYPLIPLHLAGFDISFTNATRWTILATIGVLLFFGLAARKRAVVPGRLQGSAEILVEWIAGTVKDTAGAEAMRYFPAIFTLFAFILFANLFGLIPSSFAVTSHFIVTLALALAVFIGVTLIGIFKHGLKFLTFFVPKGVPLVMLPMMIPIEIVSYLARPFSLSLRLAINMIAGHTLLKVIAGFVVMMGIWGVLPLGFLVILMGFEFGIAVLQAYVFTILTCVYLNDALHLH